MLRCLDDVGNQRRPKGRNYFLQMRFRSVSQVPEPTSANPWRELPLPITRARVYWMHVSLTALLAFIYSILEKMRQASDHSRASPTSEARTTRRPVGPRRDHITPAQSLIPC